MALCTGTLLTVSFFVLGLNYALLLGVMAGMLGIIPYLGVMISLIPAVTLAAVQFGDWLHPILVVIIFGVVNLLEGLVISPKIIGDRVGLASADDHHRRDGGNDPDGRDHGRRAGNSADGGAEGDDVPVCVEKAESQTVMGGCADGSSARFWLW